jgi:ubiquinone/menaquinone biosynthesis C-methylase UbiE
MNRPSNAQSGSSGPPRESYTHGYGRAVQQSMFQRTAETHASFLLPYLHPGLDVVDCGCGLGSITIGIAERVAPGRVVGIDIAETQVGTARSLANDRGLTNVQFEIGTIYELPYPDGSFDVAFAHTVLEHLGDPLRALREMRRVLRPGGVVAVRDTDWASIVIAPTVPRVRRCIDLVARAMVHRGSSPYYAPQQRRLLLEAGFERTEGFAFTERQATPESTRYWGNFAADYLDGPSPADIILSQEWVDRAELDAIKSELRAWGERPDAYYAALDCAALGWVPSA